MVLMADFSESLSQPRMSDSSPSRQSHGRGFNPSPERFSRSPSPSPRRPRHRV